MEEINEINNILTYKKRKQICLYLFQQGIGYKRASKLLGLNVYTTRDYFYDFLSGKFAFAGWQAYEPDDEDFIKVVKSLPKMRSYSIPEVCKRCGVQIDKILVYSYDYEKETRPYSGRNSYGIRSEFNSEEYVNEKAIGVSSSSKRDFEREHTRLGERSRDWTEMQGNTKKKRVDKVNALVAKGVSIKVACQIVNISRSSYYRGKTQTKKQISDDLLAFQIQEIQEKLLAKYSYGIERITASVNKRIETLNDDLKAVILNGSTRINHKRIERIMRLYQLNAHIKRAKMPKNYYTSKKELEEHNKAPNILRCDFFSTKEPGKLLVTDVTYLPLLEGGFIYLSAIMDLANQEIVSYVMSNENSAAMAEATLQNATSKISQDCIIHSDQGAVYKSEIWTSKCSELCLTRSMSRKGNCWDNSVMENFFSRLKSDLHITKRESKNTFTGKELRELVSAYIYWYNNERTQKRLGFLSPIDYRKKWTSEHLTKIKGNDIISTVSKMDNNPSSTRCLINGG